MRPCVELRAAATALLKHRSLGDRAGNLDCLIVTAAIYDNNLGLLFGSRHLNAADCAFYMMLLILHIQRQGINRCKG